MSKNKNETVEAPEEPVVVEVPEPQPEPAPQPPTETQRIAEYERLVQLAGQQTLCETYARLDVKAIGQGVDEGIFRALLEVRALPLPTEPS